MCAVEIYIGLSFCCKLVMFSALPDVDMCVVWLVVPVVETVLIILELA